jgi:hypothetical protein
MRWRVSTAEANSGSSRRFILPKPHAKFSTASASPPGPRRWLQPASTRNFPSTPNGCSRCAGRTWGLVCSPTSQQLAAMPGHAPYFLRAPEKRATTANPRPLRPFPPYKRLMRRLKETFEGLLISPIRGRSASQRSRFDTGTPRELIHYAGRDAMPMPRLANRLCCAHWRLDSA